MMSEPYCRASLPVTGDVILELGWDGDAWRFHAWEANGPFVVRVNVPHADRSRRFQSIDSAREFFCSKYRDNLTRSKQKLVGAATNPSELPALLLADAKRFA